MQTKNLWHTILTVLGLSILGYFLYHTVQGEHGWMAMMRLKGQVDNARNTLSQLQKEHQELGHRVELMRPETLDPDMLDEKSREMLDYSKPNEVIILTKPAPPAGAALPPVTDSAPDLLQRSK